jgi:hypothetical protein
MRAHKRLAGLCIAASLCLLAPILLMFAYGSADDAEASCAAPDQLPPVGAVGGSFTIKGQQPTPQQRQDVATALARARHDHVNQTVALSELVAGIGESSFDRNANNGQYHGIWQSHVPPDQVDAAARYFLHGGAGFQAGGAVAFNQAHPDASPGTIAWNVEGNRSNFGSDDEARLFYDKWLPEARAMLGLPTDTVGTAAIDCPVDSSAGSPAGDLATIKQRAKTLAAMQLPYVFGGHHGEPAPVKDPRPGLDCSSAVSWVLNIVPRDSHGFIDFGEPGPGQVTLWVDPGAGMNGHVFMVIDGVGYGTGGGPGHFAGGFGRLSYTTPYRAGFTPRHVPLNFNVTGGSA